jgi:hypothetical protein
MHSVSSVLQFLRATVRHWGALVSGGAIIAFLSVWQGTGHAIPPVVYGVVAIVAVFVACYRAWNEERVAKEKAIAEKTAAEEQHRKDVQSLVATAEEKHRQALESALSLVEQRHRDELATLRQSKAENVRDWAGDWKELAANFRDIAGHRISANYSRTSAGEYWDVAGNNDAVRRIESLRKHAGDLLLASPKVCKTISAELAAYPAPDRWLFYLKATTRAYRMTGYGEETLDSGEKFIVLLGSIPDVAEVSANACMECASQEY